MRFEGAACAGADINLFFPSDGPGYFDWWPAYDLCDTCPALEPCTVWVISQGGKQAYPGAAGGLNPSQATKVRAAANSGTCYFCKHTDPTWTLQDWARHIRSAHRVGRRLKAKAA